MLSAVSSIVKPLPIMNTVSLEAMFSVADECHGFPK
jgi:hypothetical protein